DRLRHHQLPGSDEHGLVQMDGRIQPLSLAEGLHEVWYLEESESRDDTPTALADVLPERAFRSEDARRVFEYDAERDGVPRQNADESHVIHDELGNFLRTAGQK